MSALTAGRPPRNPKTMRMPDHDDSGEGPDPEESEDARQNRQLTELLNELRVALPGVQMMFG